MGNPCEILAPRLHPPGKDELEAKLLQNKQENFSVAFHPQTQGFEHSTRWPVGMQLLYFVQYEQVPF